MSERRRRPRVSRGALFVILVAALVVALLAAGWAKCGLGRDDGDSEHSGDPTATPAEAVDAARAGCALRVSSDGAIHMTGEDGTVSREQAIARCRDAREVTLEAAGDAPFGDVEDLRRALERAGLPVRELR